MKILFAGTPDIAVPSLEALAAAHDVVGVLTAPDAVSGRGRHPAPPPVKSSAGNLGLRVLQPERLDGTAREDAARLGAELMVVFAYGKIFGPKFLSLFPLGAVNLHPSALPKYRGPSPLTAAILAGDEITALSVQRVSSEMDAGDILLQVPLPLDGNETTGSLTSLVAGQAPSVLLQVIGDIECGSAVPVPQDHGRATYCRLVKREDGEIDWREPAAVIERKVRAYTPWPGARTRLRGEPLTILESQVSGPGKPEAVPGAVLGVDKSRGILLQTGDDVLAVRRLQMASRKPLDFKAFLNGVKLDEQTILGVDP